MTTLTPFHATYRSDAGDGAPHLTLLHGWGLHSLVWDDLMPELLAYFQVTVIDLPGMGQSPLPSQPYTLDFLAEQVAAVLPEKTHLLGWSLGGLVALRLASRWPERAQSVVTLATNPCFCARPDWPTATPPVLLEKFAELLKEDNNGTLIRFAALMCNGSASQKEDIRKLKDILHFCGLPAPRALREGLQILREADLRAELSALPQPVLMLFGEHDAIVPVAAARAVSALVPRAQVDVLSAASHVPQIALPEVLVVSLESFWRAHGAFA